MYDFSRLDEIAERGKRRVDARITKDDPASGYATSSGMSGGRGGSLVEGSKLVHHRSGHHGDIIRGHMSKIPKCPIHK
jgi:hypothetical protein